MSILSKTKGKDMIALPLFLIVIVIWWGVIKILSEFETISLQLEKTYSRIDEHAKMTEEAHKHNLDEKRKSER